MWHYWNLLQLWELHDCDVLNAVTQTAVYEDLLKKEGEITVLKAKALQLMQNHEEAVGYDDMRQQLQQLGNVSAFIVVICALAGGIKKT